ncbi:MAG: VWA domain-containing protein, partial [Candidatus Bipolaricaulota bacterium]
MTRKDRAARGHPLAACFAALLAVSVVAVSAVGIPHVRVEQIADPTEIYTYGQEAEPDVATLKLFVEGLSLDDGVPIDCVLIVDVSATATGGLGEAATLALDLLALFEDGDRVGLVSFSDRAWLDVGLTDDHSRVLRAVADLETGGKSALGEGLRVARQELLDWGRDDARLVEIILSDGQSNIGRTPEVEGDVAAEAGIILIPIGVGTLINRNLLEELAEKTGGVFVPRVAEDTVEQVDEVLSATPGPMTVRVEKTLPPELAYRNATPSPTSITGSTEGTVLVWEFELVPMWSASIEVSAAEEGEWLTDVDSVVTVTDERERVSTYTIPARTISVMEPLPPTAFFYLDPTQPQVGVEAKLDAGGSVVYQDGEIELYAWDLDGDGRVDLLAGQFWFRYVGEGRFEAIQLNDRPCRVQAGHFRPGKVAQ